MTVQHHHSESTGLRNRRHLVRSVLEFVQDLIVIGLCVGIFAAMVIKLLHLGRALMEGTDFSQVLADIMFILVLMELFRLLLIYLEEHRVSISTMVEVGIVAAIREAPLDRRIARELTAIVSALRIHSDAGLGAPLRRHSNLAVRRTGLSGNFSY